MSATATTHAGGPVSIAETASIFAAAGMASQASHAKDFVFEEAGVSTAAQARSAVLSLQRMAAFSPGGLPTTHAPLASPAGGMLLVSPGGGMRATVHSLTGHAIESEPGADAAAPKL